MNMATEFPWEYHLQTDDCFMAGCGHRGLLETLHIAHIFQAKKILELDEHLEDSLIFYILQW
jgi:hypothetical protein